MPYVASHQCRSGRCDGSHRLVSEDGKPDPATTYAYVCPISKRVAIVKMDGMTWEWRDNNELGFVVPIWEWEVTAPRWP
ncbi:MAG: hypothetical protein QM770_10925 [Tepidisphaeraceae bacterium]